MTPEFRRKNEFAKWFGQWIAIVQHSRVSVECTFSNQMRRSRFMTKKIVLLLMCFAITLPLFAKSKSSERLAESTAVLKTILNKQEIPMSVVDKAVCVLVYPSVRKVGIGLGVTYGRGMITCRTGAEMNGKWSAPAMYTLDTGSL